MKTTRYPRLTRNASRLALPTGSRRTLPSIVLTLLLCLTGMGWGQSSLTSPPAGSILGYPSFTLTWRSVSANEYFLYLGSAQGANDYFSASMGKNTSVGLTWSGNRPPGCWVRLWSHMVIYSGVSKSTVAASYWTYTDAYYKLGTAVDAKTLLITDYLNLASAKASTNANVGQCKAFLVNMFTAAAGNYRLPNGNTPVMPGNPFPKEGVGVSNWYWNNDAESGWLWQGAVTPSQKNKYDAVMALLRTVQKGDTLQFVMRSAKTLPANKTNSYVPHTIAFRSAYVSDSTAMDWVDSNMKADGIARAGTTWWWGDAKTPGTLAERIALQYGACTLYRVRSDVSKR